MNRLQHLRSSGLGFYNNVQIMCNTSSTYHVQHIMLQPLPNPEGPY